MGFWEGIKWVRKARQKIIFLKIDFKKSYNRIEWDFILMMLLSLGFEEYFLNMTTGLFFNASIKVLLNGIK